MSALAVTVVPTPLGRRVGAILIDLALVYALAESPGWAGVYDARIFGGVLLALVYFVTRDALWHGRSVGKRLMRLRVLEFSSLAPASLTASLRRNGLFVGCCFGALVLEIVARRLSVPFGVGRAVGVLVSIAFCYRYIDSRAHRTKLDSFGSTVVIAEYQTEANQ